jgi:hypothetical protein
MASQLLALLNGIKVQSSGAAAATGSAGTTPTLVRQPGVNVGIQLTGVTTAGAGSATILIQGSNDGVNWWTIATSTLTTNTTIGTAAATGNDFQAVNSPWKYLRCNITAISGTNCAVTANMAA